MNPETPFLAVDLDSFDRNAASMAARIVAAGRKTWRPHVKAIRVPALAKRLLAAGATGVTAATVDEAQAMVESGIEDVMIANILVGASKLERVARLNARSRVAVCIDHVEHVELLDRAGRDAGVTIPVLVEVDIGMRRAGVADAAAARALATSVTDRGNLHFAGLTAWEGHATRIADRDARAAAVREAVGGLVAAARACERAGLTVATVSCGGTATYEITSGIDGVTEIQAGGGVFGDLRSRNVFGLDLDAALGVVATVVSRPAPHRAVCDAGWKAIGTFPVQPQLRTRHHVQAIAWSAEHAAVEFDGAVDDLSVGDRVTFDVGYSDSTVFLHDRLVVRRGEAIEAAWPIARRVSI